MSSIFVNICIERSKATIVHMDVQWETLYLTPKVCQQRPGKQRRPAFQNLVHRPAQRPVLIDPHDRVCMIAHGGTQRVTQWYQGVSSTQTRDERGRVIAAPYRAIADNGSKYVDEAEEV
jgi:hypothetical protein